MTAAEEDRIRRRKATEEAAKVRKIYEELVLKKPAESVVQIGSVAAIKASTAAAGGNGGSHTISTSDGNGNANGNGHSNGNGNGHVAPEKKETTVVN
jgi:hypothetical protein